MNSIAKEHVKTCENSPVTGERLSLIFCTCSRKALRSRN